MLRMIAGRVVTGVLIVAALAMGSWFVVQAATGASLVTFTTGSMSPTMPQGSLGIGIPTPVSEISVGDVITVQRKGMLPVTHRVVAFHGEGEERTFTMKGDANDVVDPSRYAVGGGLKIVWSMPALGTVMMVLQHPLGRGLMLLTVGSLVTWAFWPGGKAKPYRGRHRREVNT